MNNNRKILKKLTLERIIISLGETYYTRVCLFVFVYVCVVCVRECIYVCLCMYVCLTGSVSVCHCVCTNMHTLARTHTYANTIVTVSAHARTRKRGCT